jgi:serine protease Do
MAGIHRKHQLSSLVSMILVLTAFSFVNAAGWSPRAIYSKTAPAVVFISAFNERSPLGSCGTGSIIDSNGTILTNSHVLTDPKTGMPYAKIVVCLKPEHLSGNSNNDLTQRFSAHIVTRSPELDLAVLKIDRANGWLPTVVIGDAGEVATGDPVAAIGHPEGGGLWILTTGTISGVKKMGAPGRVSD